MRIRGISGWKHHHLIAVTSVVIVAAAAAGGYIGLTSGKTGPSSTRGQSARPGAGASSQAAADAPRPGLDDGATGSAGSGDIACPMIPAGPGPTSGSTGIGSATHLFTRTTADAVTIRAYRLPATASCGCGPVPAGSSGPVSSGSVASSASAEMMTEGAVSIELSDDTAVGVGTLFDGFGSTAVTTNAGTGPVVPVSDAFGVAEGTPVWWTAVSVGSDVASAQMTFADGSTDQMAPIDGVVVLAHSIDPGVAAAGPGPYVVRGTLRLLDSSGAVLNTVSIPEVTATPAMPPVPVAVSPPLTMPASAIHAPVPALSSAAGADGGIAVCDDTAVPTPTPEAVAPSIAP